MICQRRTFAAGLKQGETATQVRFLQNRPIDFVAVLGERGLKYQTCTDEKWAGDGKDNCNAVISPFRIEDSFLSLPTRLELLGGRICGPEMWDKEAWLCSALPLMCFGWI